MTGQSIQDAILPAASHPLVVGALVLVVVIAFFVVARGLGRRRPNAGRPVAEPADPVPLSPSARTAPATVAAPVLEKTMTKASDLFVACLEEEGCEYVFGVPGEENLDFLDSLSRSRKIKLILTRH